MYKFVSISNFLIDIAYTNSQTQRKTTISSEVVNIKGAISKKTDNYCWFREELRSSELEAPEPQKRKSVVRNT